jgi:hypothetical protein
MNEGNSISEKDVNKRILFFGKNKKRLYISSPSGAQRVYGM